MDAWWSLPSNGSSSHPVLTLSPKFFAILWDVQWICDKWKCRGGRSIVRLDSITYPWVNCWCTGYKGRTSEYVVWLSTKKKGSHTKYCWVCCELTRCEYFVRRSSTPKLTVLKKRSLLYRKGNLGLNLCGWPSSHAPRWNLQSLKYAFEYYFPFPSSKIEQLDAYGVFFRGCDGREAGQLMSI